MTLPKKRKLRAYGWYDSSRLRVGDGTLVLVLDDLSEVWISREDAEFLANSFLHLLKQFK